MYRGYELKIAENQIKDIDIYASKAESLYADFKKKTDVNLLNYKIGTTSQICGDLVENSWFPKGEFHLFISHSGADKKIAKALAYIMKNCMGVATFVDSLVWDYRDDLVKRLYDANLDSEWDEKVKLSFYSSIIAHVDCMLNKSLTEIMDGCECLLFLNTPNSVSAEGVYAKTLSPWIYGELEASRRLRVNTPIRRMLKKNFSKSATVLAESAGQESFKIKMNHSVNTGHLKKLTCKDICSWLEQSKSKTAEQALDILYDKISK